MRIETVSGAASARYDWDEMGRMLAEGPVSAAARTREYRWSVDDRLLGVTLREGGPDRTIAYAYDPRGTLTSRRESATGEPGDSRGLLVDYENPTGYSQSLAEVSPDGVTPLRDHIYDESGIIGQRRENPDFFHNDHLGTVRALTAQGGSVPTAGQFAYEPYGLQTAGDSSLTPYAFTGQWRDGRTGEQYHRARWYLSTARLWLSPDPVFDFPANLGQTYGYSLLPISASDPSGALTLGEIVVGVANLARLALIAYTAFSIMKLWAEVYLGERTVGSAILWTFFELFAGAIVFKALGLVVRAFGRGAYVLARPLLSRLGALASRYRALIQARLQPGVTSLSRQAEEFVTELYRKFPFARVEASEADQTILGLFKNRWPGAFGKRDIPDIYIEFRWLLGRAMVDVKHWSPGFWAQLDLAYARRALPGGGGHFGRVSAEGWKKMLSMPPQGLQIGLCGTSQTKDRRSGSFKRLARSSQRRALQLTSWTGRSRSRSSSPSKRQVNGLQLHQRHYTHQSVERRMRVRRDTGPIPSRRRGELASHRR